MAIRDLTGCRFGMLVALEATAERKDECVVDAIAAKKSL